MTSPRWEDRREALAAAARARSQEIAAALERRRGMPAAPGDLFVLPATSELPVEWALLDRRPGAGDLLAVPADSHPLVGSADLAVEPAGTPVLRCRYPVWLEPGLLDPQHRSGVLPPETAAAALRLVRQLEAGEADFSPLGEEVDSDPEYGDWLREVPERARSLAAGARTARPPDGVRSGRRWMPLIAPAVAATLAVVSIGLSAWVVQLQRQVEDLSAAVPDVPSEEVQLGATMRADRELEVDPETRRIRLTFVVDEDLDAKGGFLEVEGESGQVVWRSRPGELSLPGGVERTFRRIELPDGRYRVRVYPDPKRGSQPLSEEVLKITTANAASP